MSHYMTALAMKQEGIKPATKIVLYWLADHHNGDTGDCFPSLNLLARECEMSRPTVVKHLNELEELGLIVRAKRQRENGSQTSTAYILNLTPVKNLNSPCKEIEQPPVKKRDPHNLVNNNLVNEPIGPKPKPKQKRAVSLPENWVPSDRNIKDARDRGFSKQEIEHEADRFLNYHHSKGSIFKSWDAAWRTWLGNARKFSKPTNADTTTRAIATAARARRTPGENIF
jgi:DNA-binding transcriptional MocR family regulator